MEFTTETDQDLQALAFRKILERDATQNSLNAQLSESNTHLNGEIQEIMDELKKRANPTPVVAETAPQPQETVLEPQSTTEAGFVVADIASEVVTPEVI